LPADAARFDAFLFVYGGQVLSSDKTKAVFNDQKGQDALTFFSSFQLQDKSSALPDSLGATWPGDAFGKQKAAMAIEGGWLIPYMHDTYPTVQYGSVQLPKFPVKQASLLFTNGWGCSAKSAAATGAGAVLLAIGGGADVLTWAACGAGLLAWTGCCGACFLTCAGGGACGRWR